jgi:hypothetical protein
MSDVCFSSIPRMRSPRGVVDKLIQPLHHRHTPTLLGGSHAIVNVHRALVFPQPHQHIQVPVLRGGLGQTFAKLVFLRHVNAPRQHGDAAI